MKKYEELVREYRKRQRDTVVDTLAAGLTYMDEIAVDTGLLEETGLLTDLLENAAGVIPFAIITVSEGSKILLKKKPGKTGLKDGAFRMAKTGAAMGVRAMFDRYRSKALTGYRVQSRIRRLRELNRFIRNEEPENREELPERERMGFAAEGAVA